MARILCAWEFGGGLGHLRRLLPIARELRAMGHGVAFTFRDPLLLEPAIREGFEGFAAPQLRAPRVRNLSPLNFSDILLNQGFGDAPGLRMALRAWRDLLALFEPDALLADYAPTALLAARSAGVAAVTVGTGFALPVDADPLPALRPWAPVDPARLREVDARLIATIRQALGADRSAPRAARDLFEARAHLLCTFRELDPFGARAGAEYIGPQGDDAAGIEVRWVSEARPRIFAYLKPDDRRFRAVIAALHAVAGEAIVAAPGLDADSARAQSHHGVRVIAGAVQLEGLLEDADLCVTHAGPGIAARALVAGVPLAMLPMQVEQFLIAQRLQESGAGEIFAVESPVESLQPWLASLLAREGLRQAARERAASYRDFSFAAATSRAATRIAAIAAA
ncbi:MAG: glycosyltransferase [Usitatibacter sp.]